MKRLALALTTLTIATVMAGGAAMAVTSSGPNSADNLQGTDDDDIISALEGDDTVKALGGADRVFGGGGDDTLWGGSPETTGDGHDDLRGEEGDDYLAGGTGLDIVRGGPGNDTMVDYPGGEAGQDEYYGGDGKDIINTANSPASKDFVYCGDNYDVVEKDNLDIVAADCELVNPQVQPDDGSPAFPQEQGDPDAVFDDADISTQATLPSDRNNIHSQWKYRFLNDDTGWLPLRYGYHLGSGRGFGYRHIKAQRGWGWGVRWNMNRALLHGRLVRTEGSSRTREWIGQFGCRWQVVYDVKVYPGFEQEKGVITFYDDRNDPDCPSYTG